MKYGCDGLVKKNMYRYKIPTLMGNYSSLLKIIY